MLIRRDGGEEDGDDNRNEDGGGGVEPRLNKKHIVEKKYMNEGGQMVERLGNRAINQKVDGSNPSRAN